MITEDQIRYLASKLPSQVVNSKELTALLAEVNIHLSLGCQLKACKDCIARCFMQFKRVYNQPKMDNGMYYLFRTDIDKVGYRYNLKVLNNRNTTEEERKEVYLSNKSRHVLFDQASLPTVQEKVKQFVFPTDLHDPPERHEVKPEKPKRKYTRKKKQSEPEAE